MAVALVAGACTRTGPPATKLVVQMTDLGADRYRVSAPDRIRAGVVQVVFTNRGRIPHDAQLLRVDGAHSAAEVADTIRADGAPTPEWLHAEGGVGLLAGGQTGTATVNLTAGSYYISDTGVDEDNIAFAKAGAIRALAVDGTSDVLPAATAIVAAREYAFEITGLKAGAIAVRFDNVGAQTHEFLAAPLLPGKTLDDVRRSLAVEGQSQGPSPMDYTKAVAASRLDPGRSLVTTLHLQAGRYAFVCLLSDRQGGPRHLSLGMIAEATVAQD